ncbi:MAG: hypothetical protein R3305_02585 [Gammaproteobacteria bacterium]|nr:hypothetical protein [Gammaproteobacteria bacterium]
MNCTDVSRCLDERDIAGLSAAETVAIQGHAAHCADCAATWRVSRRLAAFRTDVPPLPVRLERHARRLDEARDGNALTRSRRPVIVGGLLAFGALATMFAAVPFGDAGTAEAAE